MIGLTAPLTVSLTGLKQVGPVVGLLVSPVISTY